jgi:hypothetical protein
MACALAPWSIIASTVPTNGRRRSNPKLDHRADLTDLQQDEGEQGRGGSGKAETMEELDPPEAFPWGNATRRMPNFLLRLTAFHPTSFDV